MKKSFCLICAPALVLLCAVTSQSASAATITSNGVTTVASAGTAPGSAADYTFFGSNSVEFGLPGGNQPTTLTSYVVSTLANNQYPGNSSYTRLAAPGGSPTFTTGSVTEVPTDYPNTTPHTELLATFSPITAGSFSLYLLDGNTDGVYVGNSSVGISQAGGTEVATATQYTYGVNEFTEYTITGATAGEIFDVYATTSTNAYPTIGGITFSGAPVPAIVGATPEPSSLTLLGTGAITLAAGMRRRLRTR